MFASAELHRTPQLQAINEWITWAIGGADADR